MAMKGFPFRRRAFLKGLGLGAASLGFGGAMTRTAHAEAPKRPPNLMLIMADDLSARELGCYGHRGNLTPNLDALAQSGVMFRTCWATPICSPSRAEIMTGRYAFRTKWFHNDMKTPEPLCDDNPIFAQVLKQAGHATAIAGK